MNQEYSLYNKVLFASKINSEKIAISGLSHKVTYKKLSEIVGFFIKEFNKLDLGNSVISIFMSSDIDYIASILSLTAIRSIFSPINESWPDDRVVFFLNSVKPTAIIVNANSAERIKSIISKMDIHVCVIEVIFNQSEINVLPLSETLLPRLSVKINKDSREEDSLYLMPTSGTTGVPKIVEVKHKALSNFIEWQTKEFMIDSDIISAQLAPISFDVSLRDIFLPLTNGGTLCIPSNGVKFHPMLLANWISDMKINTIHTVPSLLKFCIDTVKDIDGFENKFITLSKIYFSGEALLKPTVNFILKYVSKNALLTNLYGPTECTLVKTFYKVKNINSIKQSIIPLGYPIPGVKIILGSFIENKIKDINKTSIGEILIETHDLAKGYYNDKKLTQEKFRIENNGVRSYQTGDLGYFDSKGCLHFSGRIDSQVKIRGNRVELSEIENVILTNTEIKQTAISFVTEFKDEDRLCSLLVSDKEIDIKKIVNLIKKKLPSYMVPTDLFVVDEIVLNDNGKLNRNKAKSVCISLLEKSCKKL